MFVPGRLETTHGTLTVVNRKLIKMFRFTHFLGYSTSAPRLIFLDVEFHKFVRWQCRITILSIYFRKREENTASMSGSRLIDKDVHPQNNSGRYDDW